MIRVADLHISFDGKIIIDGIEFEVKEGKSLVLVGKNGSGKSVILKALAGLIDDYCGTIEINGQDIKKLYSDRYRIGTDDGNQFRIAYVFQKGGLFDSMSVFENVAFGLRRMNVNESSIQDLVTNSLARVGLSGSEEKLPSELSGGMQKRVGLARAVCLNPNVIFFDDPTAGLDPILSDTIADLILEIRESLNTTSIIVTHDMKVANKVADKMALLYQGKLAYQGSCDDFFSEENAFATQFIEGDITGPIDIF